LSILRWRPFSTGPFYRAERLGAARECAGLRLLRAEREFWEELDRAPTRKEERVATLKEIRGKVEKLIDLKRAARLRPLEPLAQRLRGNVGGEMRAGDAGSHRY
jgi:hypothetical protein